MDIRREGKFCCGWVIGKTFFPERRATAPEMAAKKKPSSWHPGAAPENQSMDIDSDPGKAQQNRREGRPACKASDVPASTFQGEDVFTSKNERLQGKYRNSSM